VLFFIGGAARTGKGILVRRLLAEQRLPYLSLDVLKMGLARGVPEFAVDPNAGALEVAERLWPLVREMSRSLLFDRVHYVFEGEVLPKHVAGLRDAHSSQVRGCFLGYAEVAPSQKLHDIRAHANYPNDWPRDYTDAALLPIIDREIRFSRYLREECDRYGFPYFDTSHQFESTLDQVVDYVQAALRAWP
jgi:putative acetyltransferase